MMLIYDKLETSPYIGYVEFREINSTISRAISAILDRMGRL